MKLFTKFLMVTIATVAAIDINAIEPVHIEIRQGQTANDLLTKILAVKAGPYGVWLDIDFDFRFTPEEKKISILSETFSSKNSASLSGVTLLRLGGSLKDLPTFEGLSGLIELNMRGNYLTTESLAKLRTLPHPEKLKALKLSQNNLTSPLNLDEFTNLGLLDLANNTLTAVPELKRFNELIHLKLGGNRLTSKSLSQLNNLPHPEKLEDLNLWSNRNPIAPPDLSKFINLKLLDLRDTRLTQPLRVPAHLKLQLDIKGLHPDQIVYEGEQQPQTRNVITNLSDFNAFVTESLSEDVNISHDDIPKIRADLQTRFSAAQREFPNGLPQAIVLDWIKNHPDVRKRYSPTPEAIAPATAADRELIEIVTAGIEPAPTLVTKHDLAELERTKKPSEPVKNPFNKQPITAKLGLDASWQKWKDTLKSQKEGKWTAQQFDEILREGDQLSGEHFTVTKSTAQNFAKLRGMTDNKIAAFLRQITGDYVEVNALLDWIKK